MVQKNSLKKVIVIVGPTGVGKTKISIAIAKKYNLEIINADQSQMRKKLNTNADSILKPIIFQNKPIEDDSKDIFDFTYQFNSLFF